MTKSTILAAAMAATITLWTPPGFAQPSEELKALKKDIETLREGQTAIQKDLQEIKTLLRARPTVAAPAPEAVVSVDGAPFKGKKDALVTLVDFTDYQ